jgi:uncharacterized membrane protein
MRENVDGSPPIIEAVTPTYRWGGRFANNTGLPAVAGWEWHQIQQRGKLTELTGLDVVRLRQEDVNTFYSTLDPEEAQFLLEKHGVRYVILGHVERNYYPADGLAKIEAGLGGMLRQVYRAGQTTVYEVVTPDTALVTGE